MKTFTFIGPDTNLGRFGLVHGNDILTLTDEEALMIVDDNRFLLVMDSVSGSSSGSGSPIGVITPGFLNQFYRRTDVQELYQAVGLTNADWVQWS